MVESTLISGHPIKYGRSCFGVFYDSVGQILLVDWVVSQYSQYLPTDKVGVMISDQFTYPQGSLVHSPNHSASHPSSDSGFSARFWRYNSEQVWWLPSQIFWSSRRSEVNNQQVNNQSGYRRLYVFKSVPASVKSLPPFYYLLELTQWNSVEWCV